MINVKLLADSVNSVTGDRITTFLLTYPRFIHSELMTHRVFSRNAASSRAIPVEKMIEAVRKNCAMPVEWGTTQRGMQAGPPLDGIDAYTAETTWRMAMHGAIKCADDLLKLGVHKQIANRLLEPFAHMTTLVTATEWGNFFRLRAHPDAQPEFQRLAYDMLEAYASSEPKETNPDGWHLPFDGFQEGTVQYDIDTRVKVCVARCARVSYVEFDGTFSVERDVALYDRLLASGHMSPFEHVARAKHSSDNYDMTSNFWGWRQLREDAERPSRHAPLTRDEVQEILGRRPTA